MKKRKLYFLILAWAAIVLQGCGLTRNVTDVQTFSTPSGITYSVLSKGKGPQIDKGDVVFVDYILKLEDGTEIDNSYNRGEPVYFKVGAGEVIKGWDEVFTEFAQGDKINLFIPPQMGYGDQKMGDIPANSNLIFDLEVVRVNKLPKPYDLVEGVDAVELDNGISYSLIESGDGKKINEGMKVLIHYTGYLEDMSIFDSSYQREQPIEFVVGKGIVIKGWDLGLTHLNVGDKARFFIPYDLAYGEKGRGPIPARSNLIFDIEVIDALSKPKPEPFDIQNKDTLTTVSGLQYLVATRGTGAKPRAGQKVRIHYTGYLTDGSQFDSSVERGQPLSFIFGQGQLIEGWEEGIALMREGAKYRLIIPPSLGYGKSGIGPVPPDATLIFDVHLIDVE